MLQPAGALEHAVAEVPSSVHGLPIARGQVSVPHCPAPHDTSHAHALLQVTSPHAAAPSHVTVHCEPPLHVIVPQALVVLQVIVHIDPPLHVMSLHSPGTLQVRSHCMPLGQLNGNPASWGPSQVGGEVVRSHVLHWLGHAPLSITQ